MENNDQTVEKIEEAVKEYCEKTGKVPSKTSIENRWNITVKDKPAEA